MRLNSFRAAALAAVLVTPTLLATTALTPAYARGTPDSFADLAAQLSPAVVNVSSTQKAEAHADRGPEMPGFPPGSPFEQFFRDFMERNHPGGGGGSPAPGQRRGEAKPPGGGGDNDSPPGGGGGRAVSLGSGFIIDPAGYIVTNNHVIDGADEISVTLTDNTTLKAKLVGKDDPRRPRPPQGHHRPPAYRGEVRRQRYLPRRRLGSGHRQPLRPRWLRHRRHRQRPRPRHPPGSV